VKTGAKLNIEKYKDYSSIYRAFQIIKPEEDNPDLQKAHIIERYKV
jgi:hypothetical protein